MMSLSFTRHSPMFYAKHEVTFCSSSDRSWRKLLVFYLANLYVKDLLVAGQGFFFSPRSTYVHT